MKNLKLELNEMKFLFNYERGRVISEQKLKKLDELDVMMNEPDVMEPDVKPRTRPRPETPDTDPFPNPFDPDRAKEFNPLPDLEPQGDYDDDFMMNEPDVMEPDVKPRTRPQTPDTDPFPNPFDPDRAKEFNPLPDLEPQGEYDDDINEPFVDDVDTDYSESRSLEDLVAKYLRRQKN
jgi:hypothetical protein